MSSDEFCEYRSRLLFHCDTKTIFAALTDVRDVSRYTRSRAEVAPVPGGKYSIFDGNIEGTFETVSEEGITMKWRLRSWAPGTFSDVKIKFTPKSAHTVALELTHTHIPRTDAYGHSGQEEMVASGWKDRIFGGINKMLGIAMEEDD